MAFALPLAGELILDAEAGISSGNIVQGAETLATTFKNEVVKGSIFGTAEGALFNAGESLYHHVKKDLGFEKNSENKKQNPVLHRKKNHRRSIGR